MNTQSNVLSETTREALAAVREYATSKRDGRLAAIQNFYDVPRYSAADQAWVDGFIVAMEYVQDEIDRMQARMDEASGAAQWTDADIIAPLSFATTDLATPEQAAAGIEAYALHIVNIFDPAGPKDIQGWVRTSRDYPEYLGFALESDGAAVEALEARVKETAQAIEGDQHAAGLDNERRTYTIHGAIGVEIMNDETWNIDTHWFPLKHQTISVSINEILKMVEAEISQRYAFCWSVDYDRLVVECDGVAIDVRGAVAV